MRPIILLFWLTPIFVRMSQISIYEHLPFWKVVEYLIIVVTTPQQALDVGILVVVPILLVFASTPFYRLSKYTQSIISLISDYTLTLAACVTWTGFVVSSIFDEVPFLSTSTIFHSMVVDILCFTGIAFCPSVNLRSLALLIALGPVSIVKTENYVPSVFASCISCCLITIVQLPTLYYSFEQEGNFSPSLVPNYSIHARFCQAYIVLSAVYVYVKFVLPPFDSITNFMHTIVSALLLNYNVALGYIWCISVHAHLLAVTSYDPTPGNVYPKQSTESA